MVLGFKRVAAKLAGCIGALCFLLLCCSNPYERDNPQDTIHTYTVTFNAGEAAGGVPPADMAGHYGDAIQLPYQGGLMRYGYGLRKWKADSLGKLISYEAGGRYTVTGNIAMSAVWVPVYAVSFDGNGATSGTAPAAVSADSGTVTVLPANGTLERAGYSFAGWDAASPYMVTGNATLYARWIPVYTVSFDGNGATGGTPPAAVSVDSGTVIQLPDEGSLERSDYLFTSWNTDSSGTGTRYEAGSSHTVAGNITLYAVWMWIDPEKYYYDERDSRLYRITAIGTQTWMAENLNYNATGSKCYSNLDSNCDTYGRLYNWATAMNNASSSTAVPSGVRGVCPEGWHLPSRAEWEVMTAYIGGASTEGKKLKATSGWNDYQGKSGNGTDDYGFSALPGGSGHSDGSFYYVGDLGCWWSASEAGSNYAYYRGMYYYGEAAGWDAYLESFLFSVRCLQD